MSFKATSALSPSSPLSSVPFVIFLTTPQRIMQLFMSDRLLPESFELTSRRTWALASPHQSASVVKVSSGWRSMKGRSAHSAVWRWVSACSVRSARCGESMPRLTTNSPSGQTTQPARPSGPLRSVARSSPAPGGASAASITAAACSKSSGSVASSAAHRCSARALNSSSSSPCSASASKRAAAKPGQARCR